MSCRTPHSAPAHASSASASGVKPFNSSIFPVRTFAARSGSLRSARPTAIRSNSSRSIRSISRSSAMLVDASPPKAARKSPDRPTEPTVMVGAGDLLGPAGEVEVAALELRAPRTGAASSGYVRAGVDQRPARPPAPSASGQLHGEVLLLPLADAEDDRRVRATAARRRAGYRRRSGRARRGSPPP